MSCDAIAEAREARGGLTFDWRRGGSRPFWLLLFLILSVAGHALCFSLFQVVYPPQKRELIQSVEVTVLDPADPLTRDVLSRIDDRAVALDARTTLALQGQPMEESAVRFRPFFRGYRPRLRTLPPLDTGESGSLLPAGSVVLPPVAAAPPRRAPAGGPGAASPPDIQLRWQADRRELSKGFEWQPGAPPVRPPDVDQAAIYIGIDRTGMVVHALPEQGVGLEMDAAILSALRAMRFAPEGGGGIDWAWATVRW